MISNRAHSQRGHPTPGIHPGNLVKSILQNRKQLTALTPSQSSSPHSLGLGGSLSSFLHDVPKKWRVLYGPLFMATTTTFPSMMVFLQSLDHRIDPVLVGRLPRPRCLQDDGLWCGKGEVKRVLSQSSCRRHPPPIPEAGVWNGMARDSREPNGVVVMAVVVLALQVVVVGLASLLSLELLGSCCAELWSWWTELWSWQRKLWSWT